MNFTFQNHFKLVWNFFRNIFYPVWFPELLQKRQPQFPDPGKFCQGGGRNIS